MRGRMRWAASQLGLSAAQAAARLDSLAFATLPVSGLSDVGANFLPYLLDHWRSPRKVLVAGIGAAQQSCARFRMSLNAFSMSVRIFASLNPWLGRAVAAGNSLVSCL